MRSAADILVAHPFPGLRPFRPSEAPFFFGQEPQIEDLLELLGGERFVAVVGISGSGKSSLVNAGLIPNLQPELSGQTRWLVARCRPGNRPVQNLAAALGKEFKVDAA